MRDFVRKRHGFQLDPWLESRDSGWPRENYNTKFNSSRKLIATTLPIIKQRIPCSIETSKTITITRCRGLELLLVVTSSEQKLEFGLAAGGGAVPRPARCSADQASSQAALSTDFTRGSVTTCLYHCHTAGSCPYSSGQCCCVVSIYLNGWG